MRYKWRRWGRGRRRRRRYLIVGVCRITMP
jgi:hypothetical protein